MSLKTKKNLFWGFVLALSVALLAMVAAPKAIAALTTTGGEIGGVQKLESDTGKDCTNGAGTNKCLITTDPPDECSTE